MLHHPASSQWWCCVLRQQGLSAGGAAYVGGNASLAILNAVITRNSVINTKMRGGGALAADSTTSVTIQDSLFSYNQALLPDLVGAGDSGPPIFGGGIWANGRNITITISNSTLLHNFAYGGQMFVQANTISSGGRGGALDLHGRVHLTFTNNTTFIRNFASTGGAINSNGDANITVRNSTFVNCFAFNYGGAVFLSGRSQMQVLGGSKFAANFVNGPSSSGGGILMADSSSLVVDGNSMFVGNSADGLDTSGGALSLIGSSVKVQLRSSTFYGNRAPVGAAVLWNVGAQGNSAAARKALLASPDATLESNCEVVTPCVLRGYWFQSGWLPEAAKGQVLSIYKPFSGSLQSAKAVCERNSRCAGFTSSGTLLGPTAEVLARSYTGSTGVPPLQSKWSHSDQVAKFDRCEGLTQPNNTANAGSGISVVAGQLWATMNVTRAHDLLASKQCPMCKGTWLLLSKAAFADDESGTPLVDVGSDTALSSFSSSSAAVCQQLQTCPSSFPACSDECKSCCCSEQSTACCTLNCQLDCFSPFTAASAGTASVPPQPFPACHVPGYTYLPAKELQQALRSPVHVQTTSIAAANQACNADAFCTAFDSSGYLYLVQIKDHNQTDAKLWTQAGTKCNTWTAAGGQLPAFIRTTGAGAAGPTPCPPGCCGSWIVETAVNTKTSSTQLMSTWTVPIVDSRLEFNKYAAGAGDQCKSAGALP